MKPYALGLYEKAMPGQLMWRDKLMAAKEAGYDYIEISIDETDEKLSRLDSTKLERMELVSLMDEVGLPIRSMCLSGHRKYPLGSLDEETSRRSLEIMQKAVRFAADIGIRTIQLAGYDVYYEEGSEATRARFEENLKIATAMAARDGILLGFETMETEFMNTVGKAMKYVELVGSPYLHVYPDSGNITNAAVSYGTDVLDDLRSGEGHIIAVHLKETVPGKFREIPYGTGHVNFHDMIRVAYAMGVRRYVTEFWYVGSPDWKQELEAARRMMGDILDAQCE